MAPSTRWRSRAVIDGERDRQISILVAGRQIDRVGSGFQIVAARFGRWSARGHLQRGAIAACGLDPRWPNSIRILARTDAGFAFRWITGAFDHSRSVARRIAARPARVAPERTLSASGAQFETGKQRNLCRVVF